MRADRKQREKEESKKNIQINFYVILAIIYIIIMVAFIATTFLVDVLPILYFGILILISS